MARATVDSVRAKLLTNSGFEEIGGGDGHTTYSLPGRPSPLFLVYDDGRWEQLDSAGRRVKSGDKTRSLQLAVATY